MALTQQQKLDAWRAEKAVKKAAEQAAKQQGAESQVRARDDAPRSLAARARARC